MDPISEELQTVKPDLKGEEISRLVKDGTHKWNPTSLEDPEEFTLTCPLCEFEYNHQRGPILTIGGNDDYKACDTVRGDVIAIPFHCENDHRWVLCIGFHKGIQHVWTVCPDEDYREWDSEETLRSVNSLIRHHE